MEKLELVVPAYNESPNLRAVIRRAALAAKEAGLGPEQFTLVLVQNGSQDDSDAVLSQLAKDPELGPWFRVVKVDVNQGYGFGLWSGLRQTSSSIVGWTHADQQCDPRDAIEAFLLLKKEQPKTLIKGERFGRNKRDILVSRVFELMARWILNVDVHEMNAQPKVFRRELLQNLQRPPHTFAFDLYVLYHAAKAGYRIRTIPVKFPPRIHGLSKWASSFVGRYKTILGMIRYMVQLRKQEGHL